MESQELTEARAALVAAQKLLEKQDDFISKNIGGDGPIKILSQPYELPQAGVLNTHDGGQFKPMTTEEGLEAARTLLNQEQARQQKIDDDNFLKDCENLSLFELAKQPVKLSRYKKLMPNRVQTRMATEFSVSGIIGYIRQKASQMRTGTQVR